MTLTILLLIAVLLMGAPVLCVSSAHVLMETADAHCCGSGIACLAFGPKSPALSLPVSPHDCDGCIDIPLFASGRREGDQATFQLTIAAFVMPTGFPTMLPVNPSAGAFEDLAGPLLALPCSMPLRC